MTVLDAISVKIDPGPNFDVKYDKIRTDSYNNRASGTEQDERKAFDRTILPAKINTSQNNEIQGQEW